MTTFAFRYFPYFLYAFSTESEELNRKIVQFIAFHKFVLPCYKVHDILLMTNIETIYLLNLVSFQSSA